ncbi:TPA: hypothetical protein ACH3X1_013841 [Trebouxia sp. C0004]
MHEDKQQAFEANLAQLRSTSDDKSFSSRIYGALLRCVWWICCCFCFATNPNKPETKEPWSVTALDGHVARPAHLKISTSDKRAVEVKIVYAVNPNMPTQLYEVDVFMFFLKDLEAVSNNFYHDLWQVARLHTPKIPLAMLANDSSAGFTDLIGRELLAIESKKAAGDTASVQQEVDGVVQQLRLHVCIFRNAIRRALKGISEALERLEGSQAGAADTLQACRAVTTVVGQIAQSVNRLQQVCLPCEAADAPDAVKVVWKLVDEYTLMEAERAMLKLMRSLDKHLKSVQQATAADQAATTAGMLATAGAGETVPLETGATAAAQGETDVAQQQPSAKQGTESSGDSSVWLTREMHPEKSQNALELPHIGMDEQASEVAHAPQQMRMEQNGVSSDNPLPHQRPEPQQTNALLSNDNQLADIVVDQQPAGWTNMRQQPYHFSGDQQLAKQHSSRSQRSRHTTADLPAPFVMTPLEGPILVRALSDGRRGKLEYRLSQDDVCSPTAAEVQALLQHGPINSSHHLQQQPHQLMSQHSVTHGSVSFRLPGRDQSGLAILNGGSDKTSTAAGNMFVNPLLSSGLEAGQDKERIGADTSGMLCLIQKIQAVQDERRRRGYHESIIVPNDPGCNEQYTNRIKCLKHNARAAVVLRPQLLAQSFLLADLVGMTIAGAAMCLATGAVFLATRFSRNQLSGVYVTIIVVGYMLKDRMKEWGKRYLQPAAMKFGFEFPDRTVKMRDSRGKRVGRCKEWVKVVGDTEVDVRVLAMRHKDKGHIPPERQALKPERVLAYRKKMEVAWNQLDPRLRGVDGLDDIMRFDLQHFCRRMQPPDEPHYSLERSEDGSMQVQKIQCARVYHINVVLRIRTSVQDTRKDKAYKEKSLQIQRARIVMDQSGIKRLEATDDSVHLSADRHAVSPGTVWRPDVHMSAMHLPKMSVLRMPTFGRHSAFPAADEANYRDSTMLPEVRSDAKNPANELVEAV